LRGRESKIITEKASIQRNEYNKHVKGAKIWATIERMKNRGQSTRRGAADRE
jgi:hypothetical protein